MFPQRGGAPLRNPAFFFHTTPSWGGNIGLKFRPKKSVFSPDETVFGVLGPISLFGGDLLIFGGDFCAFGGDNIIIWW